MGMDRDLRLLCEVCTQTPRERSQRQRVTFFFPTLAGVMDRYDSLWLKSWIRTLPKRITDSDPMAVALFREYNQIRMTSFTNLSDKEMKDLLERARTRDRR
jgi:hypothetical protein